MHVRKICTTEAAGSTCLHDPVLNGFEPYMELMQEKQNNKYYYRVAQTWHILELETPLFPYFLPLLFYVDASKPT